MIQHCRSVWSNVAKGQVDVRRLQLTQDALQRALGIFLQLADVEPKAEARPLDLRMRECNRPFLAQKVQSLATTADQPNATGCRDGRGEWL